MRGGERSPKLEEQDVNRGAFRQTDQARKVIRGIEMTIRQRSVGDNCTCVQDSCRRREGGLD